MNIFLDESLHENYGFMLIGYVLCQKNPQDELSAILEKHSLLEFHASERMDTNAAMQAMRDELVNYINHCCRWGVLVVPSNNRMNVVDDLGYMLKGLYADVFKSQLDVYIDEGIIKRKKGQFLNASYGVNSLTISASHICKGIQLADLVASFNGIRLRERIGGNPKILEYGKDAGYEPPIKAELGQFELWVRLRYSMLRGSKPLGEDVPEMMMFHTLGYGLFVSNRCSLELSEQTKNEFGTVYLGCIH